MWCLSAENDPGAACRGSRGAGADRVRGAALSRAGPAGAVCGAGDAPWGAAGRFGEGVGARRSEARLWEAVIEWSYRVRHRAQREETVLASARL